MAVTSTPRMTQGSMGQLSGFMARLGDEVQEDVVDDADGGEEKQDPREGGGWPPSRDGIAGRPGLRHDAGEPCGCPHELKEPCRRHAAEHAWIATLCQSEAQMPHLVALEETGGNGKDQGHRGQEAEQESASQLA